MVGIAMVKDVQEESIARLKEDATVNREKALSDLAKSSAYIMAMTFENSEAQQVSVVCRVEYADGSSIENRQALWLTGNAPMPKRKPKKAAKRPLKKA